MPMLAFIGPLISAIGGAGLAGVAGRFVTALTMIPLVLGVLAVLKGLLVVIMGVLTYNLAPQILEFLSSYLPDTVTQFGPEAAYIADKLALKEALGLLFAAYQVRFAIRRLF